MDRWIPLQYHADAHIIVHREANPLGLLQVRYAWSGGSIAVLDLRDDPFALYHRGQILRLGCLRLRVIERNAAMDSYYVMRDGWQSLVMEAFGRGTVQLDRFYRRLILTAAIWGLADYHPESFPTWRDLKIGRKGR